MELTPDQQNAIARLYENESLTENLTDLEAQALLEWAQGQIAANTDDTIVTAAVSAANSSGEQGVQSLVTQASTFLAQSLAARADASARENPAPAAMMMGDSIAPPDTAASDELTGRAAIDNPARLLPSGSVPEQNHLSGTAAASVGVPPPTLGAAPATKLKKTRKLKRSKKK